MLIKKTNEEKVTAFESEKAVVQGCIFEGEVLERLKDWARTSDAALAGCRLSETFQQMNITGIHFSETEILSGEGKVIKLIPAKKVLTGSYYPLILVKDGDYEYTYTVVDNEQFYLESFKRTSSNGTVTFCFGRKTSIAVKKGVWDLSASVGCEINSRIPLLEDQLLELKLTKELAPKTVYEVLSKHFFNVPMTITFDWINSPYVYGIWIITVVNGKCRKYRKYLRNNDDISEYDMFCKIDKDENSFCFRTKTEKYELRKGELVFKTINLTNPYKRFENCKDEIEKFRLEMENLLD